VVRTQKTGEVQITLHKPEGKHALPTCAIDEHYYGIDGWEALFQFPKTPGIKTSRQGHDIDYGIRRYFISKQPYKWITHGSGPLWSFGTPPDTDVWRSVNYEEISYDWRDYMIIDARGQFADGHFWGYLGKFGESAEYSDVDEATAQTLDRFMDRVCLKSKTGR
jgi:hypothetical protein